MIDTTSITVQVPDEVRRGLEQLSEQTGQSLSELVSDALAQFLAYVQAENTATESALAEIDAGVPTVPHEAVVSWMESVGTDRESVLPIP
jgi:predicted transcriptional regulator